MNGLTLEQIKKGPSIKYKIELVVEDVPKEYSYDVAFEISNLAKKFSDRFNCTVEIKDIING